MVCVAAPRPDVYGLRVYSDERVLDKKIVSSLLGGKMTASLAD